MSDEKTGGGEPNAPGYRPPPLRCFYFGCWNEAGHYMHAAQPTTYAERDRLCYYGPSRTHVDGTLAPRKPNEGYGIGERYTIRPMWAGMGRTCEEVQRITYGSNECEQGWFLRHELDTGFTALSWWDRTQGDERGACNTTVFLEGKRTSEECLAALAEHFPHVLANLKKAGIELREIIPRERT